MKIDIAHGLKNMPFLLLLLLVSCGGMAKVSDLRPVQLTGEAVERATVRNGSAQSAVADTRKEITKSSPRLPVAVAHLNVADRELVEQLRDLQGAKAANADAQAKVQQLVKDIEARDAKYADLEGRWYVWWGRWVTRFLWVLGIALFVRYVAVFLPGPIGALASTVSTVVVGAFTGGVSLLTGLADNWFFRRAKGATPKDGGNVQG